jgi:tRNA(Ile2) C34 agmatinyltransferase TiaS
MTASLLNQNIVVRVLQAVERRLWLGRHMPRCTACGTVQVQLVDARPLARWRCRECRHDWKHEPIRMVHADMFCLRDEDQTL